MLFQFFKDLKEGHRNICERIIICNICLTYYYESPNIIERVPLVRVTSPLSSLEGLTGTGGAVRLVLSSTRHELPKVI